MTAFLVFVLTTLAPEHRCYRESPVGFHDIEEFTVDHLLAGDYVAAVAAPE